MDEMEKQLFGSLIEELKGIREVLYEIQKILRDK